jgi:hypothetical protein
MQDDLPIHDLDLPEDEIQRRFDALQTKLPSLWQTINHFNSDEQTIVVIPSLTVDFPLEGSILQAYEERFLFLLLLLRQPRARLVYVTSQDILPEVLDYYLGLLPGVIASHARKRLFPVPVMDAGPQPLSIKLLQRPRIIERIRDLILDPDRAHLLPFNTTNYERDLAVMFGIPLYGADPKCLHYGTKSGSRKLFAEAGIPYPAGREDLHGLVDVVEAVREIRRINPKAEKVMVKINEGVSGDGNAMVDVAGVDADDRDLVRERVLAMDFVAEGMDIETFMEKLEAEGGIAEEMISGAVMTSPSVQLRVTPVGDVQLLSTHDQLLGGPSGQTFLGSRFPADRAYAVEIARQAEKVGRILCREGVLGRCAVDFICTDTDGKWDTYAIEVNLRKGGTTHPFLTLQFLTDGAYDADQAVFLTPGGEEKYFVASDHVESPMYRAFSHEDVFDISVRHGLHYDHNRQTGVVFHMLAALGDRGRMGLTAVENSHEEANRLYDRTLEVLDREAAGAQE